MREIALKKADDTDGRDVSNVKFIPISFGSNSSIHESEVRKVTGNYQANFGCFFAIPRIIHSVFLRNTVEFVTFIEKFLKVYSVDDVSNMGEELKVLLKSKFPGQMLVLSNRCLSSLRVCSFVLLFSNGWS